MLATAAIALALGAATADGAAARIVLNRGVDPARIGMTARQLRAKLGTPDVTERSGSTTSLVYRSRKLVVTLLRGRVQIVSTRSRRERTAAGVGPGSPLRAVRRSVRGVRCGAKAGSTRASSARAGGDGAARCSSSPAASWRRSPSRWAPSRSVGMNTVRWTLTPSSRRQARDSHPV
jgi:hypothetical protein